MIISLSPNQGPPTSTGSTLIARRSLPEYQVTRLTLCDNTTAHDETTCRLIHQGKHLFHLFAASSQLRTYLGKAAYFGLSGSPHIVELAKSNLKCRFLLRATRGSLANTVHFLDYQNESVLSLDQILLIPGELRLRAGQILLDLRQHQRLTTAVDRVSRHHNDSKLSITARQSDPQFTLEFTVQRNSEFLVQIRPKTHFRRHFHFTHIDT